MNSWKAILFVLLFLSNSLSARGQTGSELTYSHGQTRIDLHGLVDIRLVQTDDEVGFFDAGQGKTRYGASRIEGSRRTGGIGEISAVLRGQFGSQASTHLHLKYDNDQEVPVDIVEGFFQFRPVSQTNWRFKSKLGAFFPPVSMENIDVAWQSPHTITWSAINSWIGEEVRALGAELSAEYRYEDGRIEIGGSLFAGNDPAGVLLSKRGWALHDRSTTLFDNLAKPLERTDQDRFEELEIVTEIDDRPGYYLFLRTIDTNTETEFLITFYDNNAEPTAVRDGHEAWLTRFLAAGVRYEVPLPRTVAQSFLLELITQGMTGATESVASDSGGELTDVRFHAGFAMLSASFGEKIPQNLSLRWDMFLTEDRRPLKGGPLIYDESGYALTLSYSIIPWERHRFASEFVTVKSDRPSRDGTGVSRTQRNTNLIFSYRYSF